MEVDPYILKLQYEILNVPIASLVEQSGVPESILNQEIISQGWQQWWPEETPVVLFAQERQELKAEKAFQDTDTGIDVDTAQEQLDSNDLFQSQAENYIQSQRQRLRVYNLAKEIHLANKYLLVESAFLDKIYEFLSEDQTVEDYAINRHPRPPLDPASLQKLATSFKDLLAKTQSNTQLQLGTDDKGMPQVLIRDLTGHQ